MTEEDSIAPTKAEAIKPTGKDGALAPGTELPGHVIISTLGSGAMGVVHKARQTALDRIVALKTIHIGRQDSNIAVARFLREAQAVARLQHPNIVTAYDSGQSGDTVFYTMEMLAGETLEARLQSGTVPDERYVWNVIRQAAAGLAQASAVGIVHRDVKPGNLFLVPPPTGYPVPEGVPMVKVTDFGLANFMTQNVKESNQRLTSTGMILGTPMYMAPEQFGNPDADERADIYALGVTAFEMIAGKVPFSGTSVWALMREKKSNEWMADSGVSEPSLALIRRMTAPDAKERLGDYTELIALIDGVLQGKAPPEPQRKRMSPIRMGMLLAGGGALLLCAGLLTGFLVEPPPLGAPMGYKPGAMLYHFDGKTLEGWKQGGSWTTGPNGDAVTVMVGSGSATRPLRAEVEGDSYEISLETELHKAKAVELHFGVTPPDGKRMVLRAAVEDGVSVGRRDGDEGTYKPLLKPTPLGKKDRHEMRVQRVDGKWYAWFDGKFLGGWPDDGRAKLREFRLVAEDGDARFTEVQAGALQKQK